MFLRSFPSWGYLETKTIFGGFWKIVVRVRHMGNLFPLSRDKHKHFWNHHLCQTIFLFNISSSPQRDDEKHGQRVNFYILSFFAVSYLRTWKHPIVQLDIFEKKKKKTHPPRNWSPKLLAFLPLLAFYMGGWDPPQHYCSLRSDASMHHNHRGVEVP